MNPVLLEFEELLVRKPPEACRILGVPYSTYAGYRAANKELPEIVRLHIETLKKLDLATLHTLIRERLRD